MNRVTTESGTSPDQAMFQAIDALEISDRLSHIKESFFNTKPGVGSEHAVLAMESWKETEGEPINQRHAKRLKKILEGTPVVIHPGQLLVGSQTKYLRGGFPHCDYEGSYLADVMAEGRITMGGPMVVGISTEEDWRKLAGAVEYFKGKTACDAADRVTEAMVGDWYSDVVEAGGTLRYQQVASVPGVLRFEWVLARGLRGIIEDANQRINEFIQKQEQDVEKLDFWQAVLIVCEATITFSRRYAELARQMSAKEQDPSRRAELDEIARVCDWVPENPARTFHEALQSILLVHLAALLEASEVPPTGYGLLDQHLYPYFTKDIQSGRLNLNKAADLIGDFITYAASLGRVKALDWREYSQKDHLTSLTVAGPRANGDDASNELSYLILHVAGLLKYSEPHIPIRWHKDTPRWLMRKAMETNVRAGGGLPQFQNSDHIVNYWTSRGISLENARLWSGSGCSQTEVVDESTTMAPSYLNVALPVDLALHNGMASATGKRIGPETGDPRTFKTFEQFFTAFKAQCEFLIRRCLWHDRLVDRVRLTMWRTPLNSALLPGCIDKGMDFAAGGLPHYVCWLKKDRGIIPAADSLVAVKKLVFDEKNVSMGELLNALDSNFDGERGEEIRRLCLLAPKYGKDIDEADEMVRDVGKFSASVITSEKNIFGFPYTVNRNGQGWHLFAGKRMGALPNGRKAKEPLADGSLSPMQGMDTRGPTALLRSALKADFKESIGGIMTLKFPASLCQSPQTQEKLIDLTETFFKQGGSYIQYNIIDRNTLLEAKKHPEQFRDLLVRVGGYSAYFVELSPEIQDEIIQRTEQSF